MNLLSRRIATALSVCLVSLFVLLASAGVSQAQPPPDPSSDYCAVFVTNIGHASATTVTATAVITCQYANYNLGIGLTVQRGSTAVKSGSLTCTLKFECRKTITVTDAAGGQRYSFLAEGSATTGDHAWLQKDIKTATL